MTVTSKPFFQPLDTVAIALMLVLSLLIGLLLWQGDAVAPRVRDFSWQDKQVGAEDTSFTLTFSRPMDTKSVEANLQIDPPLPGKISWAGRRMVYTLLAPAPYGISYQVQLQGARDIFTQEGAKQHLNQQFQGKFSSRDRAFIYLGVEGEEQGRLILYNLTQQQKTLLTSKDLVVVDFKSYPAGEKILFSATERISNRQALIASQLYAVTTGIHSGQADAPPGKIDLVLDSKDYQNLKFDLSADGKTIVVQRVSQRNPGEFGLWVLRDDGGQDARPTPQPIQSQPGGDFVITPDSTAIAVAQGQGVAILPLQSQAEKPLDFLPQFGTVLDFAKNGSQAAMVKFNSDYTRSLFLVTNGGVQKQLLRTTGSIFSCEFAPSQNLYCVLSQLLQGQEYQEQPYLAAIDSKTGKQIPLVVLPNQREVQMSLSPDGLALLFDQVIAVKTSAGATGNNTPQTDEGQAIATSRLWLLPLLPATPGAGATKHPQPEQLPLPGFHPRWLP